MSKRKALLAAGGTGGHLFPAEALAHELIARGWSVDLATDERAGRYAGKFPAGDIHQIASATVVFPVPLSPYISVSQPSKLMSSGTPLKFSVCNVNISIFILLML